MTIQPEQTPPEAERPSEDDHAGNVVPLRQRTAQPRSQSWAEPKTAARPHAIEPLWREIVGRQLRAARIARGERIADVALRAGVAPQYLSELERGVKDGSSEMLAAVSGALGLSVLELARRVSLQPARGRFRGSDVPRCQAA